MPSNNTDESITLSIQMNMAPIFSNAQKLKTSKHPLDKNYYQGVTLFEKGLFAQAKESFLMAIRIDNSARYPWLMLGLCDLHLDDILSALQCLHFYHDMQAGDKEVEKLIHDMNAILIQSFQNKKGVTLNVFDHDIVYTTEDEVHVERGMFCDQTKYLKEVEIFWKGYVQNDWEPLKLKYHLPDEEIKRIQRYNKYVLGVGFHQVKLDPSEKILEIGSGEGKIIYALSKKGCLKNTIVTDVAVDEMKMLREYLLSSFDAQPLGYVGLLGDQLPFKKHSIDVIMMMDVVEHLYNDEFVRILQDGKRILRPGGRFIIQTPDGLRYMGNVQNNTDGSLNFSEFSGNWQHVSEKSMGYLKKTLDECGYDVKVLNRLRCVVEAKVRNN